MNNSPLELENQYKHLNKNKTTPDFVGHISKSWSNLELDDVLDCDELLKTEVLAKQTSTTTDLPINTVCPAKSEAFKNITLSLNEILLLNINLLDEIVLLEYILFIISHLKKNTFKYKEENLNFEKELHESSLVWLSDACNILAKKHNLPKINNEKKTNTIARNSYKFCDYSYNCITHYKKHKKCSTGHHYVYNYVKSDIDQIICHLRNLSINIYDVNEIYISISTIKYVLEHMYDEIIKYKNIKILA